ncbi:MAG: PAS domain S-box protein [Bacteroidales bacterium]
MNRKDSYRRNELRNNPESLQSGFWEWVPVSDQLILDEAWYKVFWQNSGVRIQSMQEKLDLIHRFDRKKVQDMLGKILSGAIWEFRVEYRMKDPDGKFFEIAEFIHVAERSASGVPARLVGLARKIDTYRLQPGLKDPHKSFVVSDFVTSLKIPCLLVNADSGKLGMWNDAALALFKLSRARMASANLFSLSAEPVKLKNSLVGNLSLIPLHYIRNGEGLLLPVEIIFNSFLVEDQNYFFCVLRDLTQQRQIEKKLRESEQSLRNTISSLGDLILVADQHGNITEHFETGCTLSDAYKELLKSGNPFPGKSRTIFLKALDRLMETQEVQQFEVKAKRNGNWWFDIRMSLRRDEFNQVTGTTVVVRDISREKEARNMFSEQGERFAELAEIMPLSMAEFDARGNILFLNTHALRLFGVPRHGLRGKKLSLREFLSADDFQKFLSLEAHLEQGSKQRAVEFFIVRPDGKRTPIICQFDIQLQGSQLIGYRAVLIDQSLQHSMEDSLVASKDLAEKKFSNRMNQISRLLGEVSARMYELGDDSLAALNSEDDKEHLKGRAGNRRKEMMDLRIFSGDLNLLAGLGIDRELISRTELSSFEIIEWISAGRWRNEDNVKNSGVQNGISVSYTNDFLLLTDKLLFFKLLRHMLIVMEESDSLIDRTLRINFADGQATFWIGDEKPSSVRKNKLADMLKIKDGLPALVEARDNEGLRIGIMNLLAEMIGGSLMNKGSLLSLNLPAQLAVPTGYIPSAGNQQLAGKRILVVDEDCSFTQQLKSRLSETGVRLWEVQTGRQCLFYCLHQELPDLVLIDPRLPDLPGIDVLNTLRKNDILIPVIAHTAFATQEDRKKFMAAGFSDCLPKPFNPEALIQTLLNALSD